MVMVSTIFNHDRPESAGTETVNLFYGKQPVRSHFTGFYIKLTGCLINQQVRTSYMTGGTCAKCQDMFSGRFQSESLVKRSYTVNLDYRHTEFLRYDLHRLAGYLIILFLNIMEYLY